ncbi:T-box transcription factor TBX6-like isoform X2 [Periplaneta americana]
MSLEDSDLWRQFHEVNTEMIITKLGRNMFPVLTVQVTGLEPDARYFILMEVCLSSNSRYKFVGSEWKPAGKAEPQLPANTRLFIHQDSPATGAHWMREPIKMKCAKLTNNPLNRNGQVVLTSMHKYNPHIHVVKTSDIMTLSWSPTATFVFPETEFIAVTAYQNEQVTKLKINNNPFAKGFRDDGLSKTKRKQTELVSTKKRQCSERNSFSSGESTNSVSPPVAEDSNNNNNNNNNNEQSKECVPFVSQESSESNPTPVLDRHCEDLSSAVTNINISTNTIQYPYNCLCYSFCHLQAREQCMSRYPYLFPPPPPPPPPAPSLLPSFLVPFPYHFSPFLHQFHPPPPYLTEFNPQPYDYSLRDKSS